jgi:hypothetical protein
VDGYSMSKRKRLSIAVPLSNNGGRKHIATLENNFWCFLMNNLKNILGVGRVSGMYSVYIWQLLSLDEDYPWKFQVPWTKGNKPRGCSFKPRPAIKTD